MCDGEHGTVGKLSADGGLDEIVCLQIDGCCGFIQDEYAGFPEQSPGETQQLSLTETSGNTKTFKIRNQDQTYYALFCY